MKKILAFLLCLLTLFIFAGCGNKVNPQTERINLYESYAGPQGDLVRSYAKLRLYEKNHRSEILQELNHYGYTIRKKGDVEYMEDLAKLEAKLQSQQVDSSNLEHKDKLLALIKAEHNCVKTRIDFRTFRSRNSQLFGPDGKIVGSEEGKVKFASLSNAQNLAIRNYLRADREVTQSYCKVLGKELAGQPSDITPKASKISAIERDGMLLSVHPFFPTKDKGIMGTYIIITPTTETTISKASFKAVDMFNKEYSPIKLSKKKENGYYSPIPEGLTLQSGTTYRFYLTFNIPEALDCSELNLAAAGKPFTNNKIIPLLFQIRHK